MKKPDVYIPADMSSQVRGVTEYVATHPESRVGKAYRQSRHYDETVVFLADRQNRITALTDVAMFTNKIVTQTLGQNLEDPAATTLRARRATKAIQRAMAIKGI